MDSRRCIMLIEDNTVDTMFIEKALKDSNVVESVISFNNAEGALDYLLGGNRAPNSSEQPALPSLIILDVKLPGMSGLDFIHSFRSHSKFKNIPIVVFSGSGYEYEKKMALDLGANNYLIKPIDINAFVKSIEEVGKHWLRFPLNASGNPPLHSKLVRH